MSLLQSGSDCFFPRSERTDAEILRLTLLPYPGGPSLYPNDLGCTFLFFKFFFQDLIYFDLTLDGDFCPQQISYNVVITTSS